MSGAAGAGIPNSEHVRVQCWCGGAFDKVHRDVIAAGKTFSCGPGCSRKSALVNDHDVASGKRGRRKEGKSVFHR